MENVLDIVRQQAEEALMKLDAQGVATAEQVADSVLRQAAYWEKSVANGERLLFVRFFSPVVQREEVFLGNILFNAFLSKTFARTIADSQLGRAELVANDLQSYYFLLRTTSDLAQLTEVFRAEVERSLPDLFFGEQNEGKGIYGSLETMLDFDKANVEPFPVFIIPQVYADRLEKAVRESLLRKIERSTLDRNPTSITANLAFFYSHDGEEMQSPPKFLGHLAFHHFIIPPEQIEKALTISQMTRQQASRLIRDEEQFTASQKWVLRKYIWFINKDLSSPSRFGWLRPFFAKTDKGDWELDAGKPKDQKAVARLVSKAANMDPKEIFEEVAKNVIAHRLSKIDACDKSELKKLFEVAVKGLGTNVDEQPDKWRMPFVRDKFLPYDERTVTDLLLDGVSLGSVMTSFQKKAINAICRVCSGGSIEAEDKSILMGQSTHRFHNQSGRQGSSKAPKACLRCATCSYLMVKLLGSEPIAQQPVPKAYNVIFHYGKHDDMGIDTLVRKLDLIWERVRNHQQKERDVASIRKAVKELGDQLAKQKNEQRRRELDAQLQTNQTALEEAKLGLTAATDSLLSVYPWVGAPSSTYEIPSLDLLTNIQSGSKIERHVLGLGMSGYRMTLFVLPQIRAPRDKEYDFAQSRFSHSRVTVTALLSFLRELCGCDGPFYYQSLPMLTPDVFKRETFYVHNVPISVKQAQNEYEAVTQLAWQLIKRRKPTESGSELFTRKILLAEQFLTDPLGRFAAVMRDSAILGQTEGSYKKLPGGWRGDWKAQDLTEYAKFIQRLSKLQEGV